MTKTSIALLAIALPLMLVQGSASAQSTVLVETLSEAIPGGTGGISVGADGRIYVADFGELLGGADSPGTTVFVVEPDGRFATFANGFTGASGNEMGPDGILYQSNIRGNYISKIYPDGRTEEWVSEGLTGPVGIVMDRDGDLIVAGCGNNTLRRITQEGISTEFSASELLACPNGITVDDEGVFYVANFGNGDVLRVTPEGQASVLATLPGNNNGHLIFHGGKLYVVARSAHQIYQVSLSGGVRLLAGTGAQGTGDGSASESTFNYPNDIGISPDGRFLYVNDVTDLSSTGALLAPMNLRRITLPR